MSYTSECKTKQIKKHGKELRKLKVENILTEIPPFPGNLATQSAYGSREDCCIPQKIGPYLFLTPLAFLG